MSEEKIQILECKVKEILQINPTLISESRLKPIPWYNITIEIKRAKMDKNGKLLLKSIGLKKTISLKIYRRLPRRIRRRFKASTLMKYFGHRSLDIEIIKDRVQSVKIWYQPSPEFWYEAMNALFFIEKED